MNFPAGKHDDQVDALGLIGQILDRMGKGTAVCPDDQKPRFMNEMTMDEVWSLARPKQPGWIAEFDTSPSWLIPALPDPAIHKRFCDNGIISGRGML
jgi:hypothetical protein